MLTSLYTLFPLFVTGFLAGFVDTIAGGGGLITVPVLMSLGISPQHALGTNKLQATFGSGSATVNFILSGELHIKGCIKGVVLTFLGASLGTLAVQQVSAAFLRFIVPFLLLAIAIYSLMNHKVGLNEEKPKISENVFYIIFGSSLGFYDGFFGPGTGSFWTMAYLFFIGYNIKRATVYTKLMNFTSNIASLLFFLIGGHVYFKIGLAMAAGQIIGARLGSRLVISKGARFIKPIFITMVMIITLKLLFDNMKIFSKLF